MEEEEEEATSQEEAACSSSSEEEEGEETSWERDHSRRLETLTACLAGRFWSRLPRVWLALVPGAGAKRSTQHDLRMALTKRWRRRARAPLVCGWHRRLPLSCDQK